MPMPPECQDPRCVACRAEINRVKEKLLRALADAASLKYELTELRQKHSAMVEALPAEAP